MSENVFSYKELSNLAHYGDGLTPIWVQYLVPCCNETYVRVAVLDYSTKRKFFAIMRFGRTEPSSKYGKTWIAWKQPPTAQEQADAQLTLFSNKKEG